LVFDLLPCFVEEWECLEEWAFLEECECLDVLDEWLEPAGVEAAAGVSAAIAPAAIPKANNAEAIKVPDLFMGSPTVI
jgi:hypothetical protein